MERGNQKGGYPAGGDANLCLRVKEVAHVAELEVVFFLGLIADFLRTFLTCHKHPADVTLNFYS